MELIKPHEGHLLCCEECCHSAYKLIEFSMTRGYNDFMYCICMSCLKDAIKILESER
jgi:hypothetical protein